jgi:hypothetical protein
MQVEDNDPRVRAISKFLFSELRLPHAVADVRRFVQLHEDRMEQYPALAAQYESGKQQKQFLNEVAAKRQDTKLIVLQASSVIGFVCLIYLLAWVVK